MICIGYAGCEAYDLILYIGRTLTKLNYRVLIVDLSSSEALKISIRHGMNLDSRINIVNYRDINYIRRVPSEEELSEFNDGVVLVSYGFNLEEVEAFDFRQMNLVINTFPHVIFQVNQLLQDSQKHLLHTKVLIRDMISADDIDRTLSMLHDTIKREDTSYLYLELADYESAIKCQRTQDMRFNKLTRGVIKYIQSQLKDILPDQTAENIRKAILSARRGV